MGTMIGKCQGWVAKAKIVSFVGPLHFQGGKPTETVATARLRNSTNRLWTGVRIARQDSRSADLQMTRRDSGHPPSCAWVIQGLVRIGLDGGRDATVSG